MAVYHTPVANRFIFIVFGLGIIPAIIPFWVSIDNRDLQRPVLLLVAHICVSALGWMHASRVAASFVSNVKTSPTHRSQLALWCGGVQRVLLWYSAFALLRFGLVFALSQFLHKSFVHNCLDYGLSPFCFWSCNVLAGPPTYETIYTVSQLVFSMGNLLIYSVFEAGLCTAIVIFTMRRQNFNVGHSLWRAWGVRLCLLLAALLIYRMLVVEHSSKSAQYGSFHDQATTLCVNLLPSPAENPFYFYPITDKMKSRALPTLLAENLAIIPFTMIDNGTLLSADLMRQSWGWIAIAQRIPAAVGGLLIYAAVIWGLLHFSRNRSVVS